MPQGSYIPRILFFHVYYLLNIPQILFFCSLRIYHNFLKSRYLMFITYLLYIPQFLFSAVYILIYDIFLKPYFLMVLIYYKFHRFYILLFTYPSHMPQILFFNIYQLLYSPHISFFAIYVSIIYSSNIILWGLLLNLSTVSHLTETKYHKGVLFFRLKKHIYIILTKANKTNLFSYVFPNVLILIDIQFCCVSRKTTIYIARYMMVTLFRLGKYEIVFGFQALNVSRINCSLYKST